MIVLKRELTLESFLCCDLDTATGITEFNKIIKNIKRQLYSEIPLALDEELNKLGNENYECENCVVEYKKVYWSGSRITDEMYRHRVNNLYLFKGEWFSYELFKKKMLSIKPFDLYLYIKTTDEYKKEDFTKRYKQIYKE